jgi:hypothetical protein
MLVSNQNSRLPPTSHRLCTSKCAPLPKRSPVALLVRVSLRKGQSLDTDKVQSYSIIVPLSLVLLYSVRSTPYVKIGRWGTLVFLAFFSPTTATILKFVEAQYSVHCIQSSFPPYGNGHAFLSLQDVNVYSSSCFVSWRAKIEKGRSIK